VSLAAFGLLKVAQLNLGLGPSVAADEGRMRPEERHDI
jgi:hypothetical protein